MSFPRFGPNGAFALFNDERDVPPGWQATAEDARRMQTLAPPVMTAAAVVALVEGISERYEPPTQIPVPSYVVAEIEAANAAARRRHRKARRG